MRALGRALRVVPGPRAIEVIPRLGWTKGTALRLIAARAARPRPLVVYAGDAANDREAFAAVRALCGLAIGVGRRVPGRVALRLRDARALGALLGRLRTRLAAPPPP